MTQLVQEAALSPHKNENLDLCSSEYEWVVEKKHASTTEEWQNGHFVRLRRPQNTVVNQNEIALTCLNPLP